MNFIFGKKQSLNTYTHTFYENYTQLEENLIIQMKFVVK
jgi:hypothetical protein